MPRDLRPSLPVISLLLVGVSFIQAQQAWVQVGNSSSGMSGWPQVSGKDQALPQISPDQMGGRAPLLGYLASGQYTLLVGCEDGYIYRSVDGGATFAKGNIAPPSNARPFGLGRTANGGVYAWYAPLGAGPGANQNYALTSANQGAAPLDGRYEVYRSYDGGITWEDTGLKTTNGVTIIGNRVEVDYGGWYVGTSDSSNRKYQGDAYTYGCYATWIDPGQGTAWNSLVTGMTSAYATRGYTYLGQLLPTGGSASNNWATATSSGVAMLSESYQLNAGDCNDGGGSGTNLQMAFSNKSPAYAFPWDQTSAGWNGCAAWSDLIPARGGGVTAVDQAKGLMFIAKAATSGNNFGTSNQYTGMYLVDNVGNVVQGGPGGGSGGDYAAYEHSVGGANGFFATTYGGTVYISGNSGANWTPASNTAAGVVDPSGMGFAGSRILIANINASDYVDQRLLAVTQDVVGSNAPGGTRIWVLSSPPGIPAVTATANGNGVVSGGNVCIGDTVVLMASTPSGVPGGDNVSYQWQVNSSGSWTNIAGATGQTYGFTPGAAGSLSYRVMAFDSLGSLRMLGTPSASFALVVNPSPIFTQVPGTTTSCPGKDQILTYSVSGPASATYALAATLNGNPVSIASLTNASGATPSTITLNSGGYASFSVFVPGSLLTNTRGDGYTQQYAISLTITAQ